VTDQRGYWDRLADYPIDASVIDPNDRLGRKNRYLAFIRDREIVTALNQDGVGEPVLDLGCGTAGLSAAIHRSGRAVVGLDISEGLLKRTSERGLANRVLFVRYDGLRFPIGDACVDGVVSYVVLNHVLGDEELARVLGECCRVLRPGGRFICIEQVRAKPSFDSGAWKHQRRLCTFVDAFDSAGLKVLDLSVIRYGHFPSTPLIRWGWIPLRWLPLVAGVERLVGRLRGVATRDYCDVLFVLEKPRDEQWS